LLRLSRSKVIKLHVGHTKDLRSRKPHFTDITPVGFIVVRCNALGFPNKMQACFVRAYTICKAHRETKAILNRMRRQKGLHSKGTQLKLSENGLKKLK